MLLTSGFPSTTKTYIAPYYNFFNGVCTVEYRQTNNHTILNKVSCDVAAVYPLINFQPTWVLVVTYICPDNIFQMALATNGTDSFAVMNYERLANDPISAGMNEYGCGSTREFFSRFNGSTVAMAVNVTGVRGRHVYNLTTESCFQPVYGIRNALQSIRLSSMFYSINFYTTVLTPEETGDIFMHFSEIRAIVTTPVSLVSFSEPLSTSTVGRFYIRYGIYSTRPSSYLNVYISNLFLMKGTKKTPTFQFGNVSMLQVASSTICETIFFEHAMSSSPSIKISAITSGSAYSDYVFVWLKDVTNRGFNVCSHEIINYSGVRSLQINYIAVAVADSNIQEITSLAFPPSTQEQRCITKKFKDIFVGTPYVYTSVEVIGNSNKPMVSWVKYVSQNYAELCLKSVGNVEHKIHILISGQLSACNNFSCPENLECKLDRDQKPYCGCISSCFGKEQREFCGSDSVTYSSMCHLHQFHCYTHGNTSAVSVIIKQIIKNLLQNGILHFAFNSSQSSEIVFKS